LRGIRSVFGKKVLIQPKQGSLVLMQGNKCLHSVRPVSGDVDRITLIFAYDPPATQCNIEHQLDAYLYDAQRTFTALADPNY
jgi:hypothetical protein